LGTFEGGHLAAEGFEVEVDEMVSAGSDREVTIAAVMGAKGDVDVSGARPKPGGASLLILQINLRGGGSAV
jgi:hypothetical protein